MTRNPTNGHLLVAEDDPITAQLLQKHLGAAGYQIIMSTNGRDAMDTLGTREIDLCLLNMHLPQMEDLALTQAIRKSDRVIPIVFLSARTTPESKLRGVRFGCDDYVAKPCNIKELLWRIQVILQRIHQQVVQADPELLRLGKFLFQPVERTLSWDQQSHRLSAKEANLLQLFCDARGDAVPRDRILENVWGRSDYFTSKSLDVYLTRLRKLLRADESLVLQNIHGFGYKLIQR
ncbi:MAG: response regulator transcription factor [Salibacteraceae bacterium]